MKTSTLVAGVAGIAAIGGVAYWLFSRRHSVSYGATAPAISSNAVQSPSMGPRTTAMVQAAPAVADALKNLVLNNTVYAPKS